MRPAAQACVATAAALLLASCSTLSVDETEPTRGSARVEDRLLVRIRTGLAVLDPSTGTIVADAPRAITSPDSSLLFSVSGGKSPSSVTTIAASTGRALHRVAAPKGLRPGVASAGGELLAFAPPHEEGATPWLPAGKRRTTIAVVSADGSEETVTYDLEGNFELEGFSTDLRQLFLLQYTPAMNPTRYGLRRLQLGSGKVRRIAADKQRAPGSMRGTGRIAAFSPSGHELYTLYTQQGPNYAHGGSGAPEPGDVYAFVHLLNLEGGWTHCIDLRAPFGTGSVTTHAMALSPDGERLFVADPSSGGLAVIAPLETKVLRSVTLDLEALTRGRASAAVGGDGTLYLAGGSEVLVIDGQTLAIVERWKTRQPVSGVGVSSDGRRLYAALPGKLAVLDASTGARTGSLRVPGIEGFVEVIPAD